MRPYTVLCALPALAGCAAAAVTAPPVARTVTAPYTGSGLERVIGAEQAGLIALLGPPQAEVHEGTATKLQFASGICVLDAYLYPKDGGSARVTYLDARQPDGSAIDRASCVAALTRKSGGR